MNLLLFSPEELTTSREIVIADDRRERLGEVVRGGRVLVGELRGRIGWGEVLAADCGAVRIEVGALEERCEAPTTELIVALPRPQMIRRILESCGPLGVRRLIFTRTSRVEKSYFQSSELREEALNRSILLGLEQGVSTEPVQVKVYRFFEEFLEGEFPRAGSALSLLADPRAKVLSSLSVNDRGDESVLAIGPERGFSEYELESFEARGFERCSFGKRILRVDGAVCYFVAQVNALMERRGVELKKV